MQISQTCIEGLLLITPKVFTDERGFFVETYQKDKYRQLGIEADFIQDNHAYSKDQGVTRGLHFQKPPFEQTKLVWVTRGAVFDVAVDLRPNSSSYGTWFSCELSADNFKRLFIPKGFAHGYMTLTEDVEFMYKVDAPYAPEHEGGIRWNDPCLDITWPNLLPILSPKDCTLPFLRQIQA